MDFPLMNMPKKQSRIGFNRRVFLAASGAGVAGSMAGCLGNDEPTEEDYMIDSLESPVQGDGDIEVEVFTDFMCPSCAEWHGDEYQRLISDYVEPGHVTLVHRDFPVPVDDDLSWEIPSAARLIQDDMGDEAFWEFADGILENQSSLTRIQNVESFVPEGIDTDAVVSAGERNLYYPVISDDRSYGRENSVTGTPSAIVDGELLDEAWGDTLFPHLDSQI